MPNYNFAYYGTHGKARQNPIKGNITSFSLTTAGSFTNSDEAGLVAVQSSKDGIGRKGNFTVTIASNVVASVDSIRDSGISYAVGDIITIDVQLDGISAQVTAPTITVTGVAL